MKHTTAIAFGALALVAPATAQQTVPPVAPTERAAVETRLQLERARIGVESRFVKGAPYSAEAVTETLQVLGDGNRIARKSVTRIYRDSEGRTRRENLNTNGEVIAINISDPVGESQYTLNPATKTAYRSMVMASGRGGVAAVRVEPGAERVEARSGEAERKAETEKVAAAAAAGGGGARGRGGSMIAYPAEVPPGVTMVRTPGSDATTIDLGQQVIEGVLATGSRSTTVIAAGAIGNDKPINIVSEQWFSEDLQVLVMTKHSDPRNGDTTYRLMNVVQAEPHRSLFEVPPDYTFRESVIRRQIPHEQ
jgi:hypothetical protein